MATPLRTSPSTSGAVVQPYIGTSLTRTWHGAARTVGSHILLTEDHYGRLYRNVSIAEVHDGHATKVTDLRQPTLPMKALQHNPFQ